MPDKLLNKAIFSDFTELGISLEPEPLKKKLLKTTYDHPWSRQDRIN